MPIIIHDPIYGHIKISPLEELIINTKEMARLRGIQQLGLADLAFPGANHTRFEHSIGTMFIAGKMANWLGLPEEDISKVRIAGLLHDIGHSPFSHVVESVLKRNPDYRPVLDGVRFSDHEMFTRYLITNRYPGYGDVASCIEKMGIDAADFFREISGMATGKINSIKKPYLAQLISHDIDADRIDFLLRDSYHTGVTLGLIDMDQIINSLTLSPDNRIVLCGTDDSYRADMAQTAAESMLVARAHHYSAIIHNPMTQGARAMLVHALENTVYEYGKKNDEIGQKEKIPQIITLFFTTFNDCDLLNFVTTHGNDKAKDMIQRLKNGDICRLVTRYNHKLLKPGTRMALSVIARNGPAKKMFEEELAKRFARLYGTSVLIDLDIASGIPKSARIKIGDQESFLYDESALANGLVRAISRQISLCVFSEALAKKPDIMEAAVTDMLKRIEELSPELLAFVRHETYLPVEGLILIFYCIYELFSEEEKGMLTLPRIRNISTIYNIVHEFSKHERLKNLFDYSFHERYGFPYSDRLYEDIQLLAAMGMIDEDLRYFEKKGRGMQRYEYVFTSHGLDYAAALSREYKQEIQLIKEYLGLKKHSIPRDMVSIPVQRFRENKK